MPVLCWLPSTTTEDHPIVRAATGRQPGVRRTEQRRLQETLQRDTVALLSAEQRKQLVALLGPKCDLSRLGRVSFQAPELIDAGGWINSKPLRIADLRGQVIVLHFWTYG